MPIPSQGRSLCLFEAENSNDLGLEFLFFKTKPNPGLVQAITKINYQNKIFRRKGRDSRLELRPQELVLVGLGTCLGLVPNQNPRLDLPMLVTGNGG